MKWLIVDLSEESGSEERITIDIDDINYVRKKPGYTEIRLTSSTMKSGGSFSVSNTFESVISAIRHAYMFASDEEKLGNKRAIIVEVCEFEL